MFICVCLCTHLRTCICTLRISHKQQQSYCIWWKFLRTFCSKDFWLLHFNIAAFSLVLCAFHGNSPMKAHISISAEGLIADKCLCSHPTWGKTLLFFEGSLALCLTESGVLKSCLHVTYNYFILQHTCTFPVAIERSQMNTSIHPRLQKKYYLHMHFYPSLLVPVEI